MRVLIILFTKNFFKQDIQTIAVSDRLCLYFVVIRLYNSFVTPTPSMEHRARKRDADSLDIECS